MKYISDFLSFVEIKTKTASQLPFFLGLGYILYRFGSLDIRNTLLFFIAMFLFDLTVTAINNHVGKRQTGESPHYPVGVSLTIIFSMGAAASVLGIFLACRTNIVVLLAGLLCFFIGVVYTFGPLPISGTPFGEVFAGLIQGVCIPLITSEVNHPGLIDLTLSLSNLVITVQMWDALCLVIVSCPMVFCISNIMLANNICDLYEDVRVKRFTLPFYIGRKPALILFKYLYLMAYVPILAGVLIEALPLASLLSFCTAPMVYRNVGRFSLLQDKRQTFGLSIKNFMLIGLPYIAGIWLANILRLLRAGY